MEYNEETIKKLEYYIDDYIRDMKNKYTGIPAIQDKINHIMRVTALAEKLAPNNELARIAAKYHDIGRFLQYELLGKFDDATLSHHVLGENVITKAIQSGKIDKSPELDIIRLSVMYHGRAEYVPYYSKLDSSAMDVLDIVSRVDAIDNGCIGAIGYLERECKEDAKNYKKNNPDLDMKQVSSDVLKFYLNGQKFDKMKYCKTYADYVLFANSLAISALQGKDRAVAKKALSMSCFGYANAIEGYKDIFKKMIDSNIANKCIEYFEILYRN